MGKKIKPNISVNLDIVYSEAMHLAEEDCSKFGLSEKEFKKHLKFHLSEISNVDFPEEEIALMIWDLFTYSESIKYTNNKRRINQLI